MPRQIKLAYSVERIAYRKNRNIFLSFLSAIRYLLSANALKDYLLCLLSAILLILSFPNFNLWLFAWFGFVPLFFAIKNQTRYKAFLLSCLTGFIFWLGIIYWLIHVTLPGMLVLALYLALYFGIFGLIIRTYSLQLTAYSLIFIPSVWVLLEYFRSHLLTGFPWALLGYSQYLNLPVIQIADMTGVWGVSFLVMIVNAAVFSAISHKLSVVSKRRYLLPVLILLITLVYGYFKIYSLQLTAYSLQLRTSVIQGNIPQEMKWDPKAKEYIADKYLDISRKSLKDNPDLIVWPEASLPVVLEEEPLYFEKVKDLTRETSTPMLLGAVTSKGAIYYNSALLVSGKGILLNKYDKLHLVPFGEYIPLRKRLRFLERVVPIGDFAAGKEFTVFNLSAIPAANFSVLICFEDLFPELSRGFVKKGADFLVNLTNDAWFKKTSAPYQHLSASVFRAVENRVFLLRAANTGISAFISCEGKIISSIVDEAGQDSFIEGYNTQGVSVLKSRPSFYTRYGDIFILVCFLLALYGILLTLRKSEVKSFKL